MAPDVVDLSSHYFVVVRRTPETWAWTYEIHRRSKPLGIRLYHEGFPSESAARLAGEKLLRRLLDGLRDMRRSDEKRPPAGSIRRGSPVRNRQARTASRG
jgi:hypothetical protein